MATGTAEEKRQSVVFAARHRYTQQTFKIDGTSELWTGDPFNLPHGVEPEMAQRQRWDIWREVLPQNWTDAQVDTYQFKHWCGGFALACLKDADLAPDVVWIDSLGFCEPQGLNRVKIPEPGDIAWFKENQHYAVVERVLGNMFDSIDGNQGKTLARPCIKLRSRLLSTAAVFYSIEKFLGEQ